MSLLVDPKTGLPHVTTDDALLQLMENNPGDSHLSANPTPHEKEQLLMLLESVGIVRRYGPKLLVPLALKGRPVCWSEMVSGRASAVLFGQRLGISPTVTVPPASFLKVMLDKCSDAECMWGCAFAYDVGARGAGAEGSGCIFVRLREDRHSVDVVAVMDEDEGIAALVMSEVDSIAGLLGKGFNTRGERMQLCPMCCRSDMFVRSGAVHAFHMHEVATGGVLQCSRYHDVTVADVVRGKLTMLDMDALPLVYPSRLHELQLPWQRVAEGGIISRRTVADNMSSSIDTVADSEVSSDLPCDASFVPSRAADVLDTLSAASALQLTDTHLAIAAPASQASSSAHSDVAASSSLDGAFHDGMFTDVSFFVLTGQVSAGDTISAADVPEFMRILSMCASQDCSCDIALSSGERKTLLFSFNVGQTIPNPFSEGLPIDCISPLVAGGRVQQEQAPRLQRFCAHDNVLVTFGPSSKPSLPKPIFLVFPGSSDNLQLCRLTPALCRTDATAACCWSELQVRSVLRVSSSGLL
jgi:hypothetical protein